MHGALRSLISFLFPAPSAVEHIESFEFDEFRARLELRQHLRGRAASLFSYRDPLVHDLIWSLKFHRSPHAARLCAQALAEHLWRCALDRPLLLPVPLHPGRRRTRGYNQIELILQALHASDPSFKYRADILRKIRPTAPQTDLPRGARLENLRGAFAVARPDAIRGRAVLVIDDVLTTGSTMEELLRLARAAGAKSARGIAIAH